MKNGDLARKSFFETVSEERRQRNLGYENERALPAA